MEWHASHSIISCRGRNGTSSHPPRRPGSTGSATRPIVDGERSAVSPSWTHVSAHSSASGGDSRFVLATPNRRNLRRRASRVRHPSLFWATTGAGCAKPQTKIFASGRTLLSSGRRIPSRKSHADSEMCLGSLQSYAHLPIFARGPTISQLCAFVSGTAGNSLRCRR
jgi:hypothetical protein